MANESIFVVTRLGDDERMLAVSAFTTDRAANETAQGLGGTVQVTKVSLYDSSINGSTSNQANAKPSTKAKVTKPASDDDAPENGVVGRKEIPEGQPDALAGLKILFTGTFEFMDRETSKATAEKYGAIVLDPKKLANVDYVILGARPGAKKIAEIEKHGLETVNEAEFYDMLEAGVPAAKRQQMAAAKPESEPAKKKLRQKK